MIRPFTLLGLPTLSTSIHATDFAGAYQATRSAAGTLGESDVETINAQVKP